MKHQRTERLLTIMAPVALVALLALQQPTLAAEKTIYPALPALLLPDITVTALMKNTIDPASKALWEAVSYVVTEKGVTDTRPTTDADWAALRVQADALVKAGTTLMLPVLRITDDPAAKTPGYQYTPQEIEQLRQQDTAAWREFSQGLQTTTKELIGAIEKKDVNAYIDLGSPINQACEGCHSQFWYRSSRRRP